MGKNHGTKSTWEIHIRMRNPHGENHGEIGKEWASDIKGRPVIDIGNGKIIKSDMNGA